MRDGSVLVVELTGSALTRVLPGGAAEVIARLEGGPNGVALGYGMIYGSTGDNREVFALDMATGKEVWKTLISGNNREGIDKEKILYEGIKMKKKL